MISQITADQFDQQVTSSTVPVLIEFFTDHCGSCQQLLPLLAEVATEREKTLRIFKFNVGDDPLFASRFRISTVPNLILFEKGTPVGQRSGYQPKRSLLSWIDSTVTAA
jgi:thioredoxin 1